jgi:predicted PurR-regulated permease PerM
VTAQQTFRNTLVVVATLAAVYALYASIRILVVLLVAIIVASAVRPSILWLRKRRISEGLAILLAYGAIAIGIFTLAVAVVPPAASQFAGYIEDDGGLAERLISAQSWIQNAIHERTGATISLLEPDGIRVTVEKVIGEIKNSVPAMAGEFGGLLGDFVLVFVIGVYWLTSRDQAVDFILGLFSIGRRAEINEMFREIENSLGAYVRGIVLVCVFVGVANFILLSLGGVPNAITLGFIVGITTALPLIGGYIGAATAVLLALFSSPVHALIAFGSFVLVQQVENHYLTPRVMSRSVGLNPILIIVVLFIGFAVGGVIGALISVPIAGTIVILLRHLVIEPRKAESKPQVVDGGILLPSTREPISEANKPVIVTPETAHNTNPS